MPKKRTDGRYEVKVKISRPGEPRKYKSVYGDTLKEARARADEMREEAKKQDPARPDQTVADAIQYWLDMKGRTLRPRTMSMYRSSMGYVLPVMGDRPLRSITVDDARQLHDQVAQHSIVQANYVATRMDAVYKDAIIRGIADSNPWQFVVPYKHEHAEKRALTAEELVLIGTAQLDPWIKAYISVLRYTGVRRGEALALDVSDVDFASGYLSVSKNDADGKITKPKTKAAVRKIPMPAVLIGILKEYLAENHSGEGLLFPSPYGHPIRDAFFTRQWWSAANTIFNGDPPKDFTPHIFRHTYASELVKNRVPPTTAMLLLGHRNIATTMDVYTHLGWQDIDSEQIVNIFDRK